MWSNRCCWHMLVALWRHSDYSACCHVMITWHYFRTDRWLRNRVPLHTDSAEVRCRGHGARTRVHGQVRTAAGTSTLESTWILHPRMHPCRQYNYYYYYYYCMLKSCKLVSRCHNQHWHKNVELSASNPHWFYPVTGQLAGWVDTRVKELISVTDNVEHA